jgi:hypothetical protein
MIWCLGTQTISSSPLIHQCSTILKFFLGLYVWVKFQ